VKNDRDERNKKGGRYFEAKGTSGRWNEGNIEK
jgi:hypothetical protein